MGEPRAVERKGNGWGRQGCEVVRGAQERGGRSRPLGCWSERVYAGSFQARGSRSCTVVLGSVGKKSKRRLIDPSRLMNPAPIGVQ